MIHYIHQLAVYFKCLPLDAEEVMYSLYQNLFTDNESFSET